VVAAAEEYRGDERRGKMKGEFRKGAGRRL
jgi:hypothetical protein